MKPRDSGSETRIAEHSYGPETVPSHLFMPHEPFRSKHRTSAADPLGPFPECSVAALSDLGLTDAEIAQYFGVEVHRIRGLLDGHDGPMENRSLREFALRVRARLLGKAK